ncbi:MAG: hypothetical protein HQ536_03160 [Parcubacteria group bacterium]|nr:hypothetical protein [Parcubacteria group bacterium]
MEAPPIEKAIKKVEKEDKEQKLESQVEEVLGRKSVKKPGRLSRFLGEVVPGYEKSVGGYWENMADSLEDDDVRESLEAGESIEEIREKFGIRTEQFQEAAFEKTAESVKESANEEVDEFKKEGDDARRRLENAATVAMDAGVNAKEEVLELTEDMIVFEEKAESAKEELWEDVDVSEFEAPKKYEARDLETLKGNAKSLFQSLNKKYRGKKWDKSDPEYKEWTETTKEVSSIARELAKKEKLMKEVDEALKKGATEEELAEMKEWTSGPEKVEEEEIKEREKEPAEILSGEEFSKNIRQKIKKLLKERKGRGVGGADIPDLLESVGRGGDAGITSEEVKEVAKEIKEEVAVSEEEFDKNIRQEIKKLLKERKGRGVGGADIPDLLESVGRGGDAGITSEEASEVAKKIKEVTEEQKSKKK